ncbi:aconitate hydratase [Chytriomyces cf. hyalinus JEL632]|nr:aconitate hydratase [Chytriomyces cf. hyalinus JEL632]
MRPGQVLARVSETLYKAKTYGAVASTARLTLAEKILYGHLSGNQDDLSSKITRGETYLKLRPDRVAMQDASAQMAILQFMLCGRKTTAVPSSIHCDHLIQAHNGADTDLDVSKIKEKEIFSFLESAAKKYGIAFWGPGSGIIHQIVLENYAAPGTLMLGTDSHTPNAGGLGMLAIGVGGADAVDGMANIPWELKAPKIMGVRLTGKLSDWATPKDVILALAGKLTVRGGTNYIIEYFGPGTETLGCTGMATICNMGAEVGATTSVFPYSSAMSSYLRATGRSETAEASDKYFAEGLLKADSGVEYDKVIEIDLATVEPHINGPFTPDAATPISQFKDLVKKNGWNDSVAAGLIGSCTNSSYEDMSRVASIARQATANGIKVASEFLVTPGSEQVRATIERDEITKDLETIGGKVLANACGPCIGQWNRTDPIKNESNSILTSFNRNFKARNDGSNKTMNFLASPEIVTSLALAGRLSFNPLTDTLTDKNGKPFKLSPPSGDALPSRGFEAGRTEFKPSNSQQPDDAIQISIDPKSQRLQVLEPFSAWDSKDFKDLKVLVKVQGKCTTDHISAAGAWLKYKGHLDNLANNTLIGAVNAYNGKINSVTNEFTQQEDTIPNVARDYKSKSAPWTVIGDWNYGEGSAREHAALQPRYLGCPLIISRSFARIHETNLKKQGVIPVTFADPEDYEKITDGCSISTNGLDRLSPGSQVTLTVTSRSGTVNVIPVNHTLSEDQIAWIKAGSALNLIRDSVAAA